MNSNTLKAIDMPQLAVAFAALVISTSSMDAIWYLNVAQSIYFERIGMLMNAQFDVAVAVLFYVFYSIGAIIFSVRPGLLRQSWSAALQGGALYGFFCFAAHNLTDLADVKGFSWEIAVIDIGWGTCMTAVACALAYFLARSVRRPASALGSPTAGTSWPRP